MKLPRNLSGAKLSRHLCKEWGYVEVHQTGSHIILDTEEPFAQRISVPAHKTLRIETLTRIMQTSFQNEAIKLTSCSKSDTFLMHRIRNVFTNWVFRKRLGDQGTWLPISPAVTYIYTLLRPSVAEHLAHPIA